MDSDEELEVMMAIEINFGKGRKGEIVVCFGDEPIHLAEVQIDKTMNKHSSLF